MQSDRPDPGEDEFSVRLAWPKADPEDAAASEPAASAIPSEPLPSEEPRSPGPSTSGPTVSGPTVSGPTATPSAPPREPVTALRPVRPTGTTAALEVLQPITDSTRMGRVFVEAFDRLADRLLERLRSLRQDVDADLAAVRSELGGVRQAVDDLGDRVQMRQLRATLDELRSDVAGLRRAVLEWPELAQVSADIAAVRSDIAYLFETAGTDLGPGRPPSELLTELQQVVNDLTESAQRVAQERPELGVLAPLVEEVASVRGELTSIRRRMVLRASPLDEDQLEQIVAAVAGRVVEVLRSGDGGRRPKRR